MISVYVIEFLNLVLRWLHLIAGVAWIGASFYFVMLDSSLKPPERKADLNRGVFGEFWAVHGGGFYSSQKYLGGPKDETLSTSLHWSKWEAYTTWLSGFMLLVLMYWLGAEIYLIDNSVLELKQAGAIAISASYLLGSVLLYDLICRLITPYSKHLSIILIAILVIVAAWSLCNIFGGRGAYMMFGASLGTIMAANVFFIIIPGQKKMVNAIRAGDEVDVAPGLLGKQRSVHNSYITLPVLFCMISNHYSGIYNHKYNWVLLLILTIAGSLIRSFFISRHSSGKPSYIFGLVGLASLFLVLAISISGTSTLNALGDTSNLAISDITPIIKSRCTGCHSAIPMHDGFSSPPKGVVYDSIESIEMSAESIYQQVVVTKAMPIANLTKITLSERELIGKWYLQNHSK